MATWRSKLGNAYPRELIDSLDGEHHRALRALLKQPENARCAECGDLGTSWASVSLGVFVCVRCSDVHRALGTHVSKVKGITGTYLWGPDEVERMRCVGNAAARRVYGGGREAQPSATASREERVELCRQKYELRLWAPGAVEPEVTGERPCAPAAEVERPRTPPAEAAPAPSRATAAAAPMPAATPAAAPARSADLLDLDDFFDGLDRELAGATPSPAPVAAAVPHSSARQAASPHPSAQAAMPTAAQAQMAAPRPSTPVAMSAPATAPAAANRVAAQPAAAHAQVAAPPHSASTAVVQVESFFDLPARPPALAARRADPIDTDAFFASFGCAC